MSVYMMAASLRFVCDNLVSKFPEAPINPLWDRPLLKGRWWRLMGLPCTGTNPLDGAKTSTNLSPFLGRSHVVIFVLVPIVVRTLGKASFLSNSTLLGG